MVRLQKLSRIVGRVVTDDGQPVEDAEICQTHHLPGQPIPLIDPGRMITANELTKTSATGEFELSGLLEQPYLLFARHSRYGTAQPVEVTPVPGRTTRADFVLPVGGSVSGRVTYGGAPVDGANVRAWVSVETEVLPPPGSMGASMMRTERIWECSATTDADGNYSISGIPEGKLSLYASWSLSDTGQNFVHQQKEGYDISRRKSVTVDFDLPEGSAQLSGIVLLDGQETKYLNILAKDGSGNLFTVIAPGGKFEIPGMPAGTWEVTAAGYLVEQEWAHTPGPVLVTLRPNQRQELELHLQRPEQPQPPPPA